MSLEIDNLTLSLLGIFAALLLYIRFFSTPQALVHPLLLGQQSDVSSVRRKGETGVYRSFATGQGSPFTVRPANTLKTVWDIARNPKQPSGNSQTQRSILDVPLTDQALSDLTRLLPLGLRALFPSLRTNSEPSSILTLIPPSTSTALPLLLLQLSAHPTNPLVILPTPSLLIKALSSAAHPTPGLIVVHADLVEDVVEQVWEATQGRAGVLIIGDPERTKARVARNAASRGMAVKFWDDVWDAGESEKAEVLSDPVYSNVHSYFYSQSSPGAEPDIVKVTHINITAGIAGVLSLFPADKRPSGHAKDVVASAARLDTPFGMTLALASIWNGAGFRFIGLSALTWESEQSSTGERELLVLATGGVRPSILFITKAQHELIVRQLQAAFGGRPLAAFAAGFKAVSISGGDVSRNGWWEKLVWRGMRNERFNGLFGDALRAVVVIGEAPTTDCAALSNLLLSMPVSRAQHSSFSAGPILNSHFYDLQGPAIDTNTISAHRPFSIETSHSGPPSSNIEVKLAGEAVEQDISEKSEKIRGGVHIRGPGALELVSGQSAGKEGWVDTGLSAAVKANGTFIVA